ncbi:uncharacterized protein STYLEM_17355 [Stylonychia lemnae]|uniref:GB1/RHD3-type G domain-containing protein n=1 Tax=Stylonychia lemnae TaxID=5949 RepID=A0A078B4T5_STYLE|nr:uncharacterized protein STYLEM_17355 [Stylonychia lemnae]|eukprot:CDW88237.1 uncharacterized protein STYLEM_17355 [Stylonychia lemnae]
MNPRFEKYLKANNLFQRGTAYHTVAVIGAQSSGKSTLLNLLFSTEFETLDQQNGRQQTTKGIWMSKNPNGSILIFDIEGTDSKERGEQRLVIIYETFNILLDIRDVGRYGASNYGLLKVIFEVNLKIFGQQQKKRLLFVLRDFDDRGSNREKYMDIIHGDVMKIWSEIYKPDLFKESVPSDFFEFEFAMIPHKIYQEPQFIAKCGELRDRFDVHAPNTLFPTLDDKNVPMDGLSIYIDSTWEKIRTQKELNLPDQRVMVANLRCNELRDEAFDLVMPQINDLNELAYKQKVDDFQQKCQNIIQEAISHYKEYAHQYDKTVYEKVQKELVGLILSSLFKTFDLQLKSIRQQIFDKFDKELRKLSIRDQVNEKFFESSQNLFNECAISFKKQIANLVVDGSGWGEQALNHQNDIDQQLRSLIQNAREKEIDKLQVLTLQAAKNNLEEIINAPIYELDGDFWEQIKKPFLNELRDLGSNSGFRCDHEEIQDFLQNLEQTIHSNTVEIVKRLFRDINTNLLRKFNKLFKKDEAGKNREWRNIEEQKIRELHLKYKALMDDVISDFKYIKLPRAALTGAGDSNSTPGGGLQRSNTVMYARLLSEQDINKVRDKFSEDIDFVLEEAIRKHHNIQATTIPWWIYLLLAFFAADNVIGWLSSPLIFYPLVMILGGISMLYSMGLGPVIGPLARQTTNVVLSRFNMQLQQQEPQQQSKLSQINKFPVSQHDHQFKIIIIGDPCCGKTSLLMRVTTNRRNEIYEMTIGVDCKSRTFEYQDKKVRLQFWDTAGQDRFTSITTSYYRGSHCCILVFDITNQDSFFHLYKWIDQYNYFNDFPIKNIIIVGNKHDLEELRAISRLEINQFCQSLNCEYLEISVNNDQGVDNLVNKVIEKCLQLQNKVDEELLSGKVDEIHHNTINLRTQPRPSIADIRPLNLRKVKKKGKCC